MLINADFSQPAARTPDQFDWVASPRHGVERVMLDRLGEEKARATSIVRYAPGTSFPPHLHPGGEEILVLSGTFSDDQGHYPAGWYLRNPPGSSHRPFSTEGTEIFVKLWQMSHREVQTIRIDTRDASAWRNHAGRNVCPLFSDGEENVCLLRLEAGETLFSDAVNSAELLVITGALNTVSDTYPQGSWMRLPAGHYPDITAGEDGALMYLKTGHLAHVLAQDT
jgi:anti-sigma factor ChrR (cupin superfamily)